MNLEPTNIISISVALNPTTQPYSVIGYWEYLTNYPSNTHEEIRTLILAKYRERFPEATRIDIRFPSL
jgi:hypothetical protein